MTHLKSKSHRTLTSALIAASLFSTTAAADDTDIFIEIEQEGAADYQPNVLFIFDTSGSMGSNITIREDYDPNTTYGSSDPSKIYVYNSSLTSYINTISSGQNSCKDMTDQITERIAAKSGDPTWYGKAGYWQIRSSRSNRWRNICSSCSSFSSSSIVDCQADQGVHGIDDDSSAVYTRNYTNSSPYTTSSSSQYNWGGINSYYYVSANYHDYLQNTETTTRSKISIMKDEATDLIDNFDGLNVGLMRFDNTSDNGSGSDDGGYVIHHFSDISDSAEKSAINNKIENLTANGYTPLAESLWEAALYYRGGNALYGNVSARDTNATNGSQYNTPIINSCQKNHIVLLTDGEPVRDGGTDSIIRGLSGSSCSHSDYATQASNTCLDELSQYMNDNDQFDEFDGEQNVITYTIGFAIDMDLLQQTAAKGGGKYYTAGNSTELKAAFTEIISDIKGNNTTFTAPAVSVNAYNNLQHRDELYYAIFKPQSRTRWSGNIKRYQIDSNGDVIDSDGINAVGSNGFFHGGAKSWWSKDVDGDNVEAGGFAEQLQTTSTTYVYTGVEPPKSISLNSTAHIFNTSNGNLTNELMGLPATTTSTERERLISWASGEDVDDVDPSDNTHNFVADPLHTRPAVVTYGGTVSSPDDVVFAMTNLGFLHAIDTDDGSEIFRFMPQTLLPNIDLFYENFSSKSRTYGLDGPLTVWRKESDDSDFDIEATDGDRVVVYFGMRRGGSNYYALDVTNRNNPKLLWRIDGGTGDFTNLGQTWSAMRLANVNWDCDRSGEFCKSKTVLFFAGGYDPVHDTTTTATTGDLGSTIYMVDAETGELLWSAGNSGSTLSLPIQNSIPSNLTVGDIDGDGAADIIFATDIMGHVWRIDINDKSTTASDFATGGMIADLSGNSGSNLRRFYNAPDVAAFAPRGQSSFFAVSVGSGYRATPKEEIISDKFYVLFQDSVFGPPTKEGGDIEYITIAESKLFDATSTKADKNDNAPHGFFVNMNALGEKVLSDAVTFAGTIFFTSYSTEGVVDQCGVNIGSGRLYAIDILDGSGKFDSGSRDINMKHPGPPPSPAVLFTGDKNGGTTPVLCVGTECFKDGDEGIPLSSETLIKKTHWMEQ